MRAAVVVVAAALLALASARCPNSCSGHGDCGGSDLCTCWPNWQGYDCSERTCEYDVAWATDARQNPHYYAECSGKGICDRTTGLCACFDGYTGSACRRSVCPNDCSGHGKCRLIAELPNANKALSVSPTDGLATVGSSYPYTGWDGDKIQACECDGGFFGPDCSQRYCPKGDDPLTLCAASGGAGTAMNRQIQKLTLTSTYAHSATGGYTSTLKSKFVGELVLHFTDSYGDVWTTQRIGAADGTDLFAAVNTATPASDTSAGLIKAALAGIPNFRLPSVTVAPPTTTTALADTIALNWAITFDNERNAGEQNLLACDPLPLGCQTAGCQPKYQQPKTWPVSVPSAAYVPGTAISYSSYYTAPGFNFHVEYGQATAASGFASVVHSFDGSGSPPSVPSSPWYFSTAVASSTLITADSIFDNSNTPSSLDQATVQVTVYKHAFATAVNWGARVSDVYAVYTVRWDFTTLAGVSATPNTDCDDLTNNANNCVYNFVPTGVYMPSGNANLPESGDHLPASETGVGFNHVPIGYGMYVNLGSSTAGLVNNGFDEAVYILFDVATVKCSVTQTQAADVEYENIECSGRGTCDHTTGTCNCFEGHYGDHCALQTILV